MIFVIRRMNPVINLHLSIIILINSIENYGQGKTKLIAYVTTNKMVRTSNTLARNHSVIVNNNNFDHAVTCQIFIRFFWNSAPQGYSLSVKAKNM